VDVARASSVMSGNRFALLKHDVLRQVTILPARFETVVSLVDRPSWQVEYALNALRAEGHVRFSRGFWRPHSRRVLEGTSQPAAPTVSSGTKGKTP
jgi:hypothetical protein